MKLAAKYIIAIISAPTAIIPFINPVKYNTAIITAIEILIY